MNIQTIAEHSVDLDFLSAKANILDAGCRGMEFANHFRALGHDVLAIDIDDLGQGVDYTRLGIAAVNGIAYVSNDKDPQARKIVSPKKWNGKNIPLAGNEVYICTLEKLEEKCGCKFDLVKLDVEGEEMDILYNTAHPIARQISCEFHAHTGAQTKDEIDMLLSYLSGWYTIHGAVWEKRHGCDFNYWDVLLLAK